MNRTNITRRTFLAGASAVAASAMVAPRIGAQESRRVSPNEKLNIAGIGVGGMGGGLIRHHFASENLVAFCDVDDQRAARTYNEFPDVPRFHDFRKMLDDMGHEIDAVIVATPDHTHAVIALACMQMGKHVYVEKPLAHNIREARILTEAARYHGVATQMGNQGHANEGTRQLCEMIWNDWIGPVHTVHIWTDRPGTWWPQGGLALPEPEEVPDYMHWDLWLGPTRERPFSSAYTPSTWRAFWDFGTGALGDMGCHLLDPANWALNLGNPASVEVVKQEGDTDYSGPGSSVITYEFPERQGMPPVTIHWYDGGEKPPRPEGIGDDEALGEGDNGSLFIGEDGVITCGTYGENPRLLPASGMEDREMPEPMIPRSIGHRREWIMACKGGPPPLSNFEYSGPFTEMVLLGVLASRLNERIEWDSEKLEVTNLPEAAPYVEGYYRAGWELQ